MSTRFNRVLVDLNITLKTAVDFLKMRKDLGEINSDANMNTKISEEQYEAFVQEYAE